MDANNRQLVDVLILPYLPPSFFADSRAGRNSHSLGFVSGVENGISIYQFADAVARKGADLLKESQIASLKLSRRARFLSDFDDSDSLVVPFHRNGEKEAIARFGGGFVDVRFSARLTDERSTGGGDFS